MADVASQEPRIAPVEEGEWNLPSSASEFPFWTIGSAARADRAPPLAVRDTLGVFSERFGLRSSLVDDELRQVLDHEPAAASYTEWMDVADQVKHRFDPVLRAREFELLAHHALEDFGVEDPFVLEFVFSSLATVGMPGDPV